MDLLWPTLVSIAIWSAAVVLMYRAALSPPGFSMPWMMYAVGGSVLVLAEVVKLASPEHIIHTVIFHGATLYVACISAALAYRHRRDAEVLADLEEQIRKRAEEP